MSWSRLEGGVGAHDGVGGDNDFARAIMASLTRAPSSVMAGLGPAIHVFFATGAVKTWMPATSAGMTAIGVASGCVDAIPCPGRAAACNTRRRSGALALTPPRIESS